MAHAKKLGRHGKRNRFTPFRQQDAAEGALRLGWGRPQNLKERRWAAWSIDADLE